MADKITIGILRALLTADTAQFEDGLRRANASLRAFSKDTTAIGRQASQLGISLTRALSAPLGLLGAGIAKAAIDFESSFAGVRKTVEGTEKEFAQITAAFREMSKAIPININDLNRLGEAAGALGTPKDALVDFARVMAEIGVTTNVTALQASESVAKIQNIFKSAGRETRNFGSALVDLGNKGASTETQILELATRIASAGHTVGMSQADVLGFSSAIANVGIDAEAGGSAFSRTIVDISTAVAKGGRDLDKFAQVADMSGADFAKAFKTDATGATKTFIEGLGGIQESGGDLIKTLIDLGIVEVRQRNLVLALALSGENLAKALEISNNAWRANTELSNEAQKRFATTASQLTLLWNRIKDVGITIGNALLPLIKATVTALTALIPYLERGAEAFAAMPRPIQAGVVALGLLVAAAGPAIYVFGQLAIALGALGFSFTTQGFAARALLPSLKGVSAWATASIPTFLALGRAMMTGLAAGFASMIAGIRGFISLSPLAIGAVSALRTAFLGLWASILPIAAAVGAIYAAFKIAQWTGIHDAIERATLRMRGFSDAEIKAALESRKLLDEIQKLKDEGFEEIKKSLEAIGWREMANAANALATTRLRAAQLAKDLPVAITRMEQLAGLAFDFATAPQGKPGLSTEVMREIAQLTKQFAVDGREVPLILQRIVAAVEQMDKAAAAAETAKKRLLMPDYVQQLSAAQKALNGLSAEARAHLAAAQKLGASQEEQVEILEKYGVSAAMAEGVLKLFTTAEAAAKKEASDLNKWIENNQNQLDRLAHSLKDAEAAGIPMVEFLKQYGQETKDAVERAPTLGNTVEASVKKAAAAYALLLLQAERFEALKPFEEKDITAPPPPLFPPGMEEMFAVRERHMEATAARRNELELESAEFAIAMAQRRGASEEELFALTEELELAKRDAAIRTENLRFLLSIQNVERESEHFRELQIEHQNFLDNIEFQWSQGRRRRAALFVSDTEKMLRDVGAALKSSALGNLGTLFFGQLGHDTTGELKKAAQEAELEYLKLQRSGRATAKELKVAFEKWREAEERANFTFGERWAQFWGGLKQTFIKVLDDMLQHFIGNFLKGMLKAIAASKLGESLGRALMGGASGALLGGGAAAASSFAASQVAGVESAIFGGGGTGGALGFLSNPAFWTNPITLGVAAAATILSLGIAKKGWFRGGEEAMNVNPRRDQFIGQFGPPGTGPQSGFHRLAALLGNINDVTGPSLFRALIQADSRREFDNAQAAIVAMFQGRGKRVQSFNLGGFVAPGDIVPAVLHGGSHGEAIVPLGSTDDDAKTGAWQRNVVNQYVTIQGVLDRDSVRQVWREHIIPLEKQAALLNTDQVSSERQRRGRR